MVKIKWNTAIQPMVVKITNGLQNEEHASDFELRFYAGKESVNNRRLLRKVCCPAFRLLQIELIFNEVANATSYRVEWAPSPAGPWTNSWEHLTNIIATGSGSATCSVAPYNFQ